MIISTNNNTNKRNANYTYIGYKSSSSTYIDIPSLRQNYNLPNDFILIESANDYMKFSDDGTTQLGQGEICVVSGNKGIGMGINGGYYTNVRFVKCSGVSIRIIALT